MSMSTENLIEEPDPDFGDYCNTGKVRYSVLNNQQNNGKRPFCQEPFKVATACLTAFCLLLLVILVATNIHKSSSVQDLPSSSAEAQMLKTGANVTNLTAELQTLRKVNSDLEEEKLQLKIKITALEASAATQRRPVQVPTQCTPVQVPTQRTPVQVPTQRTPVTAKGSCPGDWHFYNGSCYFISVYSKSWPESQNYCKLKGGDLAIVLTAEEQTFIWNLLPRGHWNAYWIGITDEETEEEWRWVDGSKLVGGFWEDGEPNNHINEDCGNMVKTMVLSRVATKSWYDAPCYMSRPWICEKKADVSS